MWPLVLVLLVAATPQETALYRVVRASFADRLYDLAGRQSAEFLQKYPQSEHAEAVTLLLAQSQYQRDEIAECLATLRQGLDKWPAGSQRDEFLFLQGEAQVKAGRHGEAATSYQQVLDQFPGSKLRPKARYGLAFAQFKQQQFDAALATVKLLAGDGSAADLDAVTRLLTGQILLAQGQVDGARHEFLAIIESFAGTSAFYEAHYWLAESLAQQREFGPAMARYRVVTEAAQGGNAKLTDVPLVARSWFGRGWVHWQLGEFTAASEAYERAATLALDPALKRDAVLKRAESSARAGETESAIAQFAEFLDEYPADSAADWTRKTIADLLAQSKQWEQALQAYNDLVASHPTSSLVAEADLQAGLCALELGKPADAKGFFQKAFTRATQPALAQKALFHLGDTHYLLKEYTSAITQYQRLVGEHPDTVYLDRALYQLGHAFWQLRNADGAITAFESLIRQLPVSPLAAPAQFQVGVINARTGQEDAARAAFAKVEANWPGTDLGFRASCAIGDSLQRDGRHQQALEKYDAIVAQNPPAAHLEQAAYSRGWCHEAMKNPAKALESFAAFIEQYPASALVPDAMFWIAQHHLSTREFLKAQEQFQLISQSHTNSPLAPDALYMAGRTANARQDYKGAIDLFESLIKAHPASAWTCQARFGQGDALTELNEFGKALNIFDTLIKDYPNCPLIAEAHGRKGDCLFTLNRYDEAVASFRVALDLAANAPAALRNQIRFKIGQCFERAEKPDDAFEFYGRIIQEAAVAPSPDEPPDRFWAGKAGLAAGSIKEQLNEWREAMTIYEKLIPLCPDLKPLLEDRIRKIRTQRGIIFP
jgi:TolA-binding protein